MNKCILIATLLLLAACNRKPFVNSKLQFEKLSADCANQNNYFKMVANINGERYEFQDCLPDNFSKDQMNVTRQGDTVVVAFPKPAGNKDLFKLTLDIDSYPRYHFITIGASTYEVVTGEN
jgi:hypothetical protein